MVQNKTLFSLEPAMASRSLSLVQDWSHIVSFEPQLYFRPQDLEDLKDFLTAMLHGALRLMDRGG